MLGGKTVIGSIVGTRNDLADVFALHAAGRTKVIAVERKLDEVNDVDRPTCWPARYRPASSSSSDAMDGDSCSPGAQPEILVGLDADDPAFEAVDWAAREAEIRGARLAIVNCFDPADESDVPDQNSRSTSAVVRPTSSKAPSSGSASSSPPSRSRARCSSVMPRAS